MVSLTYTLPLAYEISKSLRGVRGKGRIERGQRGLREGKRVGGVGGIQGGCRAGRGDR